MEINENIDDLDDRSKRFLRKMTSLRAISYQQIIQLTKFIEEKTPFSTQHVVKGAEFDNVLVVLGRGWNQYNWNQMLEFMENGYSDNKKDSFEKNRNLFYVACSRAKHPIKRISKDCCWHCMWSSPSNTLSNTYTTSFIQCYHVCMRENCNKEWPQCYFLV